MCISMALADFTSTTLYVGRQHHPRHGLIHVLGYQNRVANLADGPNAMLLHLPAAAPMTRDNFVPVGEHGDLLDRMFRALRPRGAAAFGAPVAAAGGPPPVEVFEHDVYTVLLAADARRIPEALEQVEPRRRPPLDPALLDFYATHFPDHALAVCCFDNAEARRAKPLLLWYEPLDPDLLVAPALDSHTGGPPDLAADVLVDHRVVFGTDEAPEGWGSPVDHAAGLPADLRAYLPDAVVGTWFRGARMRNADFALPHHALLAADLTPLHR